MSTQQGNGRAIGVFDSGVGGLTVVSALMRRLPTETILYLGDTARLPYGNKSPTTVRRYTQRNVAFLEARGVKAVVIACNTASAVAEERQQTEPPLWGVIEPGAAAAVAVAQQRVGVLGTESTIESGAYERAIQRLRPDLEVHGQACPLFVPLVEEGWVDDEVTEKVARRYLEPLIERGVDTLVLGCTHYPVLAPLLQSVVGPSIQVVDPAREVAELVARELGSRGLLVTPEAASSLPGDAVAPAARPDHHFCVSDGGARFQRLAVRILGACGIVDPAFSLEWVEV